jgi:hypothetical protein
MDDELPPAINTAGYGLRKPGTEVGKWSGAWVVSWRAGDWFMSDVTDALFESGQDWVAHHGPILRTYAYWRLRWQGWQPMTPEDLRKTAGVTHAK